MTTLLRRTWRFRGLALWVAVIFITTTVGGSLPLATASSEMLTLEPKGYEWRSLRRDLYTLPAALGSLVSSWEPLAGTSSQGLVIHIQDAHANPEAQRNISGILRFLAQKYPDLVIGVEGVAGPLHPEYLQFFKEYPEADQAVVDDLLQKGELGGAELFLLQETKKRSQTADDRLKIQGDEFSAAVSGPKSLVSGIEDIELYRENLKTYRELLFKRDEMKRRLTPLRVRWEAEASRGLNAALLDFLKERKRRKEGRYDPDRMGGDPDLQAYLGYLNKQVSKTLQIDLQDPVEQLRFPNLMRVILAARVQKDLDVAKVRKDWQDVFASMKKNMSASERELVRELEQWGQAKGLVPVSEDEAAIRPAAEASLYPRKLLERLLLFSRESSFPLAAHGAFLRSFELFTLQAEVEATGLFEEMNILEGMLVEKLAKTEVERELVARLNALDLLEKLLFLELTREEYSRISSGDEAMMSVVKDSPELKDALSRAYYFYDSTLLRDRVLVENAMALGKGSGGREKKVTVLITGGFHTDGIDAILRERQIGYMTLMPRMSQTDRGELYQKVMAEDHADLSAYFKVKNPFATKQEALLFREMIEVATPVLSEKYQMEPARVVAVVTQAVQTHPVLSSAVTVDASGQDGKALRFVPRTLTPKNTSIASPAITGAVAFYRTLVGLPSVPVAVARSENRQPLAHPIRKILVVDDEHLLRDLAKTILGGVGYEVTTADSGLQALEILKTWTPDIVLTDVSMPGMTGPEMVQKMSQVPELGEIPVVFLTGWNADEALWKTMQELAKTRPIHLLNKPVSFLDVQPLLGKPEDYFKYWPEVRSEVREDRQPLASPIRKILLVDDDDAITMSVGWALGRAGFDVVTASSGAEALEKLSTFTPDIILSDVQMPGMTGYEWVSEAVKRPDMASIPIVFMSADRDGKVVFDQEIKILAEQHPSHFFIKPFDLKALMRVLNKPAEHFEYWPSIRSEVREDRQPFTKKIQKILVVDDEEMVAKLAGMQLTKAGFQVEIVSSGEMALKKLETYIPDAILTDIQMPGKLGYEWVGEAVRRQTLVEVPVVFTSGYVEDPVAFNRAMERLKEAQCPIRFLGKPYERKELIEIFKEPAKHFQPWAVRSEIRKDKPYADAQARRVLVVDDDPVNRMLVSAVLGDEGLVVETADSGAEAIGKLKAWTPDVVLTDVQMPGMTGYEWARHMSVMAGAGNLPGILGTVPIVFMSADVGNVDQFQKAVAELAEKHDVSFLEKPFNLNDLMTLIQPVQGRDATPLSVRSEIREGRIPLAKPIRTILVVDNDRAVADVMVAMLKVVGFQARQVYSAAEALENLETWSPDAILTEVELSGMKGTEWVQKIPERLSDTPIVFMMASRNDVNGFQSWVTKLAVKRPVHYFMKMIFLSDLKEIFKDPAGEFIFWPPHLMDRRSEIRSADDGQVSAFDAVRAQLAEKDRQFFERLWRVEPSVVQKKISGVWKPQNAYFAILDFFREWTKIRGRALRDAASNVRAIQSLKDAADDVFVRLGVQSYRGVRGDQTALDPLRKMLSEWRMGYYKSAAFPEENAGHDALRKSIQKEADAWSIGMMRFIELTPKYHTGFLSLAQTFPESVWRWSRQPLTLSIEGPKDPKYILGILNGWHKFRRLQNGELMDLYPQDQIAQDRIGAERRRQLFLFAEGLTSMIKAAETLKPSPMKLPFDTKTDSKKRSELRGSTEELKAAWIALSYDAVRDLIPEEQVLQIDLAAWNTGQLYSEKDLAGRTGSATNARLWIAMKLIQAMGVEKEGEIIRPRLSKFLEEFMAAVAAGIKTRMAQDADIGPQVHVNLIGLSQKDWNEFVRNAPVILGLLVTLRASLSLNVEVGGSDLSAIQDKFNDLMEQEGVTLAPGQLRIISAMGSDRFKSFEGQKEADAFMARDEKLLVRRKNVKSYWITEDGNNMVVLTAGIATALLEIASDVRLNAANTYKPSQYATLLAVVTNAIQGYLRIQAAA